MSEEVVTNSTLGIADESAPKPKRQLTEAQRLAFLKAREARAKNVALRREQKLAQEETSKTTAAESSVEGTNGTNDGPKPVKPKRVRAPKIKVVGPKEPEALPAVVVTPEKDSTPAECPPAPLAPTAAHPNPEDYAKLVADIIYDKLNAEEIPEEPIPPKPRVKRAKVVRVMEEKDLEAETRPKPPTPVGLGHGSGFGSMVHTQAFNWA